MYLIERGEKRLTHTSEGNILEPPAIGDHSYNSIDTSVHFKLRKAKKFYVIVIQPMFSLVEMLSVNKLVGFDLRSNPLTPVLRTSRVRRVSGDHKYWLILHLLRRL